MSVNERPGVYSSYEVTSALYGREKGKAVGVAGIAAKGKVGTVSRVNSYAEGLEQFGQCDLSELIRVLLKNGAAAIYAVPVSIGGAAVKTDYASAFSALMAQPEIGYMLCDSREQTVHGAMLEAIGGGDEQSKYRIGIVEGDGNREALCTHAKALNSERMVLLCGVETDGVPGATAAAVAGVLSGQTDPALPMGGAVLSGLGELGAAWSDSDISTLVQAGVSPVERIGETVSVVRGVTTRTTTGGAADTTWRDLTTVLIVDDVLPAVRDSLRTRFSRTKNTAQTRGAIRTQVIIELERKMAAQIIDGYGNVSVTADENDPAVCHVAFAFQVVHGLNRIDLVAHITV